MDQFLPKELNKSALAPFCVNIQRGSLSTEIHWHDCAEIIHLKQGNAKLFLKDSWEKLNEGETAFIPKGELHCCHCTDKNALRIVIGITENLFGSHADEQERFILPFNNEKFERRIFRESEKISKLFSLLNEKNLTVTEELKQRFYVGLIYAEIFEIIERELFFEKPKPKSDYVKKIEQIIEEKYNENITAQQTAAKVNLSYSHMAKLLRDECGTNFGEMLLKHRIDAAKRLLLITNLNITDIALKVGFTDSSYFIKRFGERVGTTPLKYRENNLSIING